MPGYFDPSNNGMGGNAATDYAAYLAGQGGPSYGGPSGSSSAPGMIQSAQLPPVGAMPAPSQNMHSGRNGVNGSHMSALGRIYDSLAHAGNNTPAKQRGPLGSLIHSLFGTDPAQSGAQAGAQAGGYNIAPFSTNDPAYQAMNRDAGLPAAGSGTPGGYWGQPSAPAPQQYKPTTQLSSSQEINQKISEMLGAPPADMPPPNFPGPPDPGFPSRGMMPQMGAEMPYPVANIPPFSIDPSDQHAEGGPIHLERGGYPELWDKPIRRGYFATGGGSNYVEPDGAGDGRSDHVEAMLSPGEWVADAETVSMLGNGDNEAGARRLDGMRKKLRMQKGKALAKGKFSADAKSPEEYLASDPISDGMRRSSEKGA